MTRLGVLRPRGGRAVGRSGSAAGGPGLRADVQPRVEPLLDFDPWLGTWGAFEVAARFSATDLNDAGARGGRMALFGAGLNWYWNRYVRLMFGYELAFVRGTEETGNLQVFQGRVQLVL
ncbi:OprO/OprP family phosphate-selective porin [Candidatus Binatia bacterium]|nr:OprO/OprP family phosphate-selective porin [Candidatus Binatia bacterium]